MCNACGIRWRRKNHIGTRRRRYGQRSALTASIQKHYHVTPPPPPVPPAPASLTQVSSLDYDISPLSTLAVKQYPDVFPKTVSQPSINMSHYREDSPQLTSLPTSTLDPIFHRSLSTLAALEVHGTGPMTNKTPKASIRSLLNDGPISVKHAVFRKWFNRWWGCCTVPDALSFHMSASIKFIRSRSYSFDQRMFPL